MKVKQLVKEERPREKAIQYGIKSLSNRELLAILLGNGTQKKSVLELADEVLMKVGTMGDLATISLYELMGVKGIKEAKAVSLLAAFEVGRRIGYEKVRKKIQITCVEDVVEWLRQEIGYQKQEHFLVVFLNQKNQVICYRTMFIGTLTNASVHPREIYQEAIRLGCARILCAHNHPSGDPTPSQADIELTMRIEESGHMVAIPLMDHVIIARNSYISFRQKHLID